MAKKESNYGVTKHYDIIRTVAQKQGLSQTLVTKIYRDIFDEILNALNGGTSVSIPRVATFELVDVPARKGRNPRTGAEVDVPAKTVVKVRRRKGLNEVSKNFG